MTEHQLFIPAPRDRKGRLAWLNIPLKTMIKTLENGRIERHEKAPAIAATTRERGPLVRSGHGSGYQKMLS